MTAAHRLQSISAAYLPTALRPRAARLLPPPSEDECRYDPAKDEQNSQPVHVFHGYRSKGKDPDKARGRAGVLLPNLGAAWMRRGKS
jgi:hypothetical protein